MAKRTVPTEPLAPEQTVGNRFVREVKKQLGTLLKTKDSTLKALEKRIPNRREVFAMHASTHFTHKFTPEDVLETPSAYDGYSSGVTLNFHGGALKISASKIMTSAQFNALDKNRNKMSEMKQAFCKEHELLVEAQTSNLINKFKAFALARCDSKKNVAALTDSELSLLSKEFLATHRDHTCPL